MQDYIDFLNESIETEKEWNSIMMEAFHFEKEIFTENNNIYLNESSKQSLKDAIIKNKNNTIEKTRANVMKSAEVVKRYSERVRNSTVMKKIDILIAKLKTTNDLNVIKKIRAEIDKIRKSIKRPQ